MELCDSSMSCKGRCNEEENLHLTSTKAEISKCFCDDKCVHFGDCCLDYPTQCKLQGKTNDTDNINTEEIEAMFQELLKEEQMYMKYASCIPAIMIQSVKYSLNMVSRCPGMFTGKDSSNCLATPSNTDADILKHIPVFDKEKSILYRNIYCAKCHGRPAEELDLFGPEFLCKHVKDEFAQNVFRESGREAFLTFVLNNCSLEFVLPVSLQGDHGPSRYQCIPNKRCPLNTEIQIISRLCWVFTHIDGRQPDYDKNLNPFCESCLKMGNQKFSFGIKSPCHSPLFPRETAGERGPSGERGPGDSGFDIRLAPHFHILVDFQGAIGVKHDETLLCPPDTFKDILNQECRPLVCRDGGIPFNGSCINVRLQVEQILQDKPSVLPLIVNIGPGENLDKALDLLQDPSNFGFEMKLGSKTANCNMLNIPLFAEVHINMHNGSCLLLDINEIMARDLISMIDKIEAFMTKHKNLFEDLIITLIHHSINNQSDMSCRQGVNAVRNISLIHANEMETLGTQEVGIIYSAETAQHYDALFLPWIFQFRINSQSDSEEGKMDNHFAIGNPKSKSTMVEGLANICEASILSCSKIIIVEDEYSLNGTNFNIKNAVFKGNEFSFYILEDGRAVVCADAIEYALTDNINYDEDWKIAFMISSHIAVIITMTFLSLTILTYALFPVLRTVPGKTVMSLSIALLSAEFLLAINRYAHFNEILCKAVAVMMHFSWMATFCWMSCLAYDFSVTFSNLTKVRVSNKKYMAYSIYAWGMPGIFVIICLLIDLGANTDFHYGYFDKDYKDTCWFSEDGHLLYVFIIPLSVGIFFNLICFIRSTIGICKAMRIAKRAKNSSSHRSDGMNLLLHVKICSVLGFNWVFALLFGAFPTVKLLYFSHILCNGLQGVFIFTCFCANDRVWKMYRERFCSRLSRESESTSDNKYAVSSKNTHSSSNETSRSSVSMDPSPTFESTDKIVPNVNNL